MTAESSWEQLLVAATVAIEVPGESSSATPLVGTGFFVAPGIVATCAHVVAKSRTELYPEVHAWAVESDLRFVLTSRPDQDYRSDALDLAFLEVATERVASYDLPRVLVHDKVEIGDELWTRGHPAGMFRAGEPASFTYQGIARSKGRPLYRVHGVPVGPGFSGSPVANRRTGAVCGMLRTANKVGSAHMISIGEIVSRCAPLRL